METTVKETQDNKISVEVIVDADKVNAEIASTYKEFAKKYNFPGFRKGKAPRPVIDNYLGKEYILSFVTENLVNDAAPIALDESGYVPVGKPVVDAEKLVEQGEPYTFSVEVEVKPSFELTSYEPVEIDLPTTAVDEKEVDAQLAQIKESFSTFEDAAEDAVIAENSYADIKIATVDQAGAQVESLVSDSRFYQLGYGLLPAAFDEALLGLKVGDSTSVTIPLDDEAKNSMLLSSLEDVESIEITVTVNSIKNAVAPELTDEWVKENLGFEEGIEALRTSIETSIKQQKEQMTPALKENSCLLELQARLDGQAPDALVNDAESSLLQDFFKQLQQQSLSFDMYLAQNNLTAETFKKDVKKQAADVVTQDLSLDAWARHYEIEATDEEIREEFAKSGAEDVDALREQWRANGQLHLVRQAVIRTKAAYDVMEKAVVNELSAEDYRVKKAEKELEEIKQEAAEE